VEAAGIHSKRFADLNTRRSFPKLGPMEIQIFGTQKSADTRKALRYFKERRVRIHFVDLNQRAASKGELTRFAQRFGAEAILDRESKRFASLGLKTAHYSERKWLEILADEPLLLRTPLVRWQNKLTVGLAEEEWGEWVSR
jgi:arsenate reductase